VGGRDGLRGGDRVPHRVVAVHLRRGVVRVAAVLVVVALVLGAALLASIGTAQWLIIRHIVDRAGRWIVATALAWTAGLAVFLGFVMPLWQPGEPMALVVAIGVAGGLLMAAVTSAITGHALRRMIA